MLQQAVEFTLYFFSNLSFIGISLAVIFCVIWLVFYKPPFLERRWLWAVFAGGAVAAPTGIFLQEFVVTPLLGQWARGIWSVETLHDWYFIASVPGLFIQGLIREGAKFVPVVIYWLCLKRDINSRLGLVVGAIAGAGFGLLEAQWTVNYIIHAGWAWENIQKYGIVLAFAGFWETFFITGYNIAAGALAGFGLGKGKGWQFYLLAVVAYTILLYIPALGEAHVIEGFQVELVIAAWALLLTGIILWLRGFHNDDIESKHKSVGTPNKK